MVSPVKSEMPVGISVYWWNNALLLKEHMHELAYVLCYSSTETEKVMVSTL